MSEVEIQHRSLVRALTSAHERGVAFLAHQQTRDGRWADFETLAGASDEWVTAFVGSALAVQPSTVAKQCAMSALRSLRRRRRWSRGWGYSARVPCDADSTLWVLHLAQRLASKPSLRMWRAHRFVVAHMGRDGGVSTFRLAGPIRRFTGLSIRVRFRGWCGPHACVTALAASLVDLPIRAKALFYLRHAQRSDGSWGAYWWVGREYATALAADAMALSEAVEDRTCHERAVGWAIGQLNRGGRAGAFPLACALRAALYDNASGVTTAPVMDALGSLVGSQLADGSWPGSAALRIPPPDMIDVDAFDQWVVDGRGGGSVQTDGERCFTTATVVETLGRAMVRHV
jgi:hypothetical protein